MIRPAFLVTFLFIASAAAIAPTDGSGPSADDSTQPATAAVRKSASLTTADLSSSMFDIQDQMQGVVKPAQSADLPSLVPGIIRVVHVREGEFVRKGTPLMTLDDRVPQARLKAATVEANLTGALRRTEVDVRIAESRLSRLRTAVSDGAGAQFELIEAEGALDQAKAAMEQQRDILKAADAGRELAEAQLSQYTISAPFDGLITEIHRTSGAVDPSNPVISMANLSTLEVEMHIPSSMYGTIRQGEIISLKAGVPVSQVIHGAVISVSPVINSASNTFRCLLQIDNPQTHLPAGFTVMLNHSAASGPLAHSSRGVQ